MATRTATKPCSDLAFLCRALKAPSLAASIDRLATRARDESWTHEEFLAACLEREVAARQDQGGEGRIRATRFPARKTLAIVGTLAGFSLRRGSTRRGGIGTGDRRRAVCA